MIKKLFKEIKTFVVEEYKFLLCMLAIYIVCTFPVNYYIVIGGGISDIGERISVSEGYKSKGSFNLSYVSELKGTCITYLLSYIIPSWDRESMDLYKYSKDEKYEDIEFRGDLDLASANGSAIKTAYTLANKSVLETSSKIYVIALLDEYETNFQIQDELLSVDGQSFSTLNEYTDYIQKFKEGDVIKVRVLRKGKEKEIECKLNKNKDGRILFGIALQLVKEYDTDPKVSLKFKNSESGPSAGLMTTLEIYNQLVKEDITKSLKIAGTGTVDLNGDVGSIGGVNYKVLGAAMGGADLFLVPSGDNYDEAIKTKKEKKLDIDIIGVETVEEAIEALEKYKK